MNFKAFLGLSIALAKTEFKMRNEGSYLGMFWYVLNPLLMFVLLFLVFSDRLGNSIPFYPLYLLLGIILFNFFQQTTVESTTQIVKSDHLIKSIYFPYSALIGAVILKTIFSHIFEMFVFILFLIFLKASLVGIIFYPLILILLSCFCLGISLFLSSIAVYFIDLENIWSFVCRLLWFATPIFYSLGGQTKLYYFNLFNPIYYFITVSRDVLIYQRLPELWMIAGILIFTSVSLLLGFLTFNSLKNKFPELL